MKTWNFRMKRRDFNFYYATFLPFCTDIKFIITIRVVIYVPCSPLIPCRTLGPPSPEIEPQSPPDGHQRRNHGAQSQRHPPIHPCLFNHGVYTFLHLALERLWWQFFEMGFRFPLVKYETIVIGIPMLFAGTDSVRCWKFRRRFRRGFR